MNFLKRAWLVTKAKKGRTAPLILVTSAILIFVLAGLTIKNAADSAIESAKSKTGATVTLSVNRESLMKAFNPDNQSSDSSSSTNAVTSVNLKTADSIAKKDGIASYLYLSTTTATAGDGIEAISTSSSSSDSSDSSSSSDASATPPGGRGMKMASGDFTITGVNSTNYANDFTTSVSKITDGVGITADTKSNQAVISEDLAKANDLAVGDTFTVTATVNNTDTNYKLTVVGIYSNSSTATTAQMMSNASNPQNNIYTNIETANTMKGQSDVLDSATYTLSNPEKLDSFVKDVESEIDTDTYSVISSNEIYKQMLSPLNNISSIAQNIVILVALAGAVILTLIIILSIRERRYEIGVLMSLGENRLKIIGQFFTELFLVTLVSLVIASFAGNLVGNALGNQLLTSSTEQTSSQIAGPGKGAPDQDTASNSNSSNTTNTGKMTGRGRMGNMMAMVSATEDINNLDIKMTAEDMIKLGGIALLISFISTVLASIGIVRMEPKDILSSN